MRVIAGRAKGTRIKAPPGRGTRPTADKVREAIFDILAGQVEGARVLDLFAGSGALGIEALSRGAVRAIFVEKDSRCCALIRSNLSACGFSEMANVYKMDVLRFLKGRGSHAPFDLIFADPPYSSPLALDTLKGLGEGNWVKGDGRIVIEHARRQILPERTGSLELTEVRRYGDTCVSIYAQVAQ